MDWSSKPFTVSFEAWDFKFGAKPGFMGIVVSGLETPMGLRLGSSLNSELNPSCRQITVPPRQSGATFGADQLMPNFPTLPAKCNDS